MTAPSDWAHTWHRRGQRRADGSAPWVKTHGTVGGYSHGCRCADCGEANGKRSTRASRERNRKFGIARVSARPSREKLRALAWMGWSTRELSRRYSMSAATLDRIREGARVRCEPKTHDAVHMMFEDLCMTRAPGNGGNIARALARKNGWPSPMAID